MKKRPGEPGVFCFSLLQQFRAFASELGRDHVDNETVERASGKSKPEHGPRIGSRGGGDHGARRERQRNEGSEAGAAQPCRNRKAEHRVDGIRPGKPDDHSDEDAVGQDSPHERRAPDVRRGRRRKVYAKQSKQNREEHRDAEALLCCGTGFCHRKRGYG